VDERDPLQLLFALRLTRLASPSACLSLVQEMDVRFRQPGAKPEEEILFDLLQPLQPSLVELLFQAVMHGSCPINTIGSADLGDFSPKRNETFDHIQFVHGYHGSPLLRT
jgi:hypothetical protein